MKAIIKRGWLKIEAKDNDQNHGNHCAHYFPLMHCCVVKSLYKNQTVYFYDNKKILGCNNWYWQHVICGINFGVMN